MNFYSTLFDRNNKKWGAILSRLDEMNASFPNIEKAISLFSSLRQEYENINVIIDTYNKLKKEDDLINKKNKRDYSFEISTKAIIFRSTIEEKLQMITQINPEKDLNKVILHGFDMYDFCHISKEKTVFEACDIIAKEIATHKRGKVSKGKTIKAFGTIDETRKLNKNNTCILYYRNKMPTDMRTTYDEWINEVIMVLGHIAGFKKQFDELKSFNPIIITPAIEEIDFTILAKNISWKLDISILKLHLSLLREKQIIDFYCGKVVFIKEPYTTYVLALFAFWGDDFIHVKGNIDGTRLKANMTIKRNFFIKQNSIIKEFSPNSLHKINKDNKYQLYTDEIESILINNKS